MSLKHLQTWESSLVKESNSKKYSPQYEAHSNLGNSQENDCSPKVPTRTKSVNKQLQFLCTILGKGITNSKPIKSLGWDCGKLTNF